MENNNRKTSLIHSCVYKVQVSTVYVNPAIGNVMFKKILQNFERK